jgi:hypothetical protein
MVLLVAVALVATGVWGCDSGPLISADWTPQPKTDHGLTHVARTKGDKLLLSTRGGEVDFVPGVNVGATLPGTQPGELAVSGSDYARWFPLMASLGLRAVRVYTILPPVFYEQLAAFNRAHPDAPLYLIQGVWIPEEEFLESQDLFSPAVRDGFKKEIGDAVAAVHGRLERQKSPGAAWGTWTADVGPWLYAYSLGIEWDSIATKASDDKNAGQAKYKGEYFSSSKNASPTEIWLAEMLDNAAASEAEFGSSAPLTFTNWPTTDPLDHPDEPLDREDLVGVDANHIRASGDWPGGYFASYHAYPYYPDFQRHEPGLLETEYNGRPDPYAGYLSALRKYHSRLPVMITEFGVPSAMALAHLGPLERDQGDHSEQEQMAMDAELLRMIHDLGLAGGFVFEWADEWFKFTWNTIEYELPPERRALWRNPWTNEEYFGLLAMDPGTAPVAIIDGAGKEWEGNGSQVIFEGASGLREVRAVKDEGYLYLRVLMDDPRVCLSEGLTLGLDVISGGNGGLPGLPGVDPEADYAVVLGRGEKGQAYVRGSNDQFTILWGKVNGYVPYDPAALAEGSGAWLPERLITNKPMTVPSTGEKLSAEFFEAGQLRYGSTDPVDPAYDSRATWAVKECLEIRLPYEAIGFSDPSSLQALRVNPSDRTITTETVQRVGLSVALGSRLYPTKGYGWDPWQEITWQERLKAGVEVYQRALAEVIAR